MENKTADSSKSKHDAGWNDPPLFSYNDHFAHSAASAKRTHLNKRVAFPLDSSQCVTQTCIKDPTSPPTFNATILPPPKCTPSVTQPDHNDKEDKAHNDHCSQFEDKHEMLEFVMTNLQEAITKKEELETNELKRETILKKLAIMKDFWKEDKLHTDIHQRMVDLSEALKNGETEKANHIQVGMMVDHPRQCSSWISAIRQLIN